MYKKSNFLCFLLSPRICAKEETRFPNKVFSPSPRFSLSGKSEKNCDRKSSNPQPDPSAALTRLSRTNAKDKSTNDACERKKKSRKRKGNRVTSAFWKKRGRETACCHGSTFPYNKGLILCIRDQPLAKMGGGASLLVFSSFFFFLLLAKRGRKDKERRKREFGKEGG